MQRFYQYSERFFDIQILALYNLDAIEREMKSSIRFDCQQAHPNFNKKKVKACKVDSKFSTMVSAQFVDCSIAVCKLKSV